MSIESFQINKGIDPIALFGNILGFILLILTVIGAGILIYGISQLAQAYQEKSPDAMQKGIVCCIVGGIMIGMRVILSLLGIGG